MPCAASVQATPARRLLQRRVLPALGALRLRDVTPDHVRRVHRKMSKTPVEANRALTAFAAVFGWADRTELTPAGFNPCRHVARYAETGTRRALTDDELTALGVALHEAEGALHPSAILAIRFLALTGFRRAELIGHMSKDRRGGREGLRWGDVDLDAGLITLRDSKTGRQVRVIGRAAVELLLEARPQGAEPDDPVCPGSVQGQPFIGIDKGRRKPWQAAELDGVDLHSLRATALPLSALTSSQGASQGMSRLSWATASSLGRSPRGTSRPTRRDSGRQRTPSPERLPACSGSGNRRRW